MVGPVNRLKSDRSGQQQGGRPGDGHFRVRLENHRGVDPGIARAANVQIGIERPDVIAELEGFSGPGRNGSGGIGHVQDAGHDEHRIGRVDVGDAAIEIEGGAEAIDCHIRVVVADIHGEPERRVRPSSCRGRS